jgi:hypothetical protein
MNKLSFASLACLLLTTACVVNPDDDDNATTNNSNVSNVTNDTDDTTDPTTGDPTTGEPETTTGEPDTTTGTPDTTTGMPSTGADETANGTAGAGCGWGMLGPDDDVEFGYLCGGEGEDPAMMFPLDCPADLTEGGDCTEAMITAEGCCDAAGNAWFCQDPDGDNGPMPPAVTMDEC